MVARLPGPGFEVLARGGVAQAHLVGKVPSQLTIHKVGEARLPLADEPGHAWQPDDEPGLHRECKQRSHAGSLLVPAFACQPVPNWQAERLVNIE